MVWQAKYGATLSRRKAQGSPSLTRSETPYVNLSLRVVGGSEVVDRVQLNQAKVALRRALSMEGVGMMVRFPSHSLAPF